MVLPPTLTASSWSGWWMSPTNCNSGVSDRPRSHPTERAPYVNDESQCLVQVPTGQRLVLQPPGLQTSASATASTIARGSDLKTRT